MDRPNAKPPPWVIDFILLAAIWGASFLFMRLAVVEFGALPTAMLRAGIGALSLLPLLVWQGNLAKVASRSPTLFVAGMLNSGFPSAGISFALLTITSGLASIMNATAPLFAAVLAFAIFGHKPGRLAAIGLVIGFAGVAALAWKNVGIKSHSGGPVASLAMATAAFGALSGASSALYIRRYLSDVPPLAIAAGTQIGATLGLLIPALLLWPGKAPGLHAWLSVTGAGVLCTGVGSVLFFRVLARAGAARAMTVTFLMPLFAMTYGIVFLSESVTGAMLGCAVMIIGGTALSTGLGERLLRGWFRPPGPSV